MGGGGAYNAAGVARNHTLVLCEVKIHELGILLYFYEVKIHEQGIHTLTSVK